MATPRSKAVRKRRREQERWRVAVVWVRLERTWRGGYETMERVRLLDEGGATLVAVVRRLRDGKCLAVYGGNLFVRRSDAEARMAYAVLEN